jgi:uncharacterized protein YaiI (UPF0178 family)
MTTLYIDGDACPVRDEVYRVADRLGLPVFVVANGSRPIRPTGRPNVTMITVEAGADVADDWIAERVTRADVCITVWPKAAEPFLQTARSGHRTISAMRWPDARSDGICGKWACTPVARRH